MADVELVCGPPCAGKTSYVQAHAKPGDAVVDYDAIARELGSPSSWDHPERVRKMTRHEVARRIAAVARGGSRAWVIRSSPDQAERDDLAAQLGANVTVLAVPADEAKRRAAQQRRPGWTAGAIDRWWSRYTTPQPTAPKGTTVGKHNAEKRRQLLKEGKALPNPDGPPRFPIEDVSDLDSAIGLARTPEERRHVYKHARRLGKIGMIPAHWKADGTLRGG